MKVFVFALAAFFSSQAFASNFSCIKNPSSDALRSVEFNGEGLSIGFWESLHKIPAKSLSNIESVDKVEGHSTSQILIANQVTASWGAEGDSGSEKITAVVVYNPLQKAARVTFLADGLTILRNELYTDCK